MQSFLNFSGIPIRCMFCLLCFSPASSWGEKRGSINPQGTKNRQGNNRQKRRIKYNKIKKKYSGNGKLPGTQIDEQTAKNWRRRGEAVTGPSGAGRGHSHPLWTRSTALGTGAEGAGSGTYIPSLNPWRPVQSVKRWSRKSLLEHGHTENHLSFSTWVWTGDASNRG